MSDDILDHESVVQRAATGARLLTARGAGMRLISVASNLALIVLVTPAQLGLLAVVRGIAGLAGDTSDLGFAWALLRRQEPPSREEYRTLAGIQFTLVFAFSGLAILAPSLVGAAGGVAWRHWAPLVLLTLLTVPLGTGARIRIERAMEFRRIAFADLSGVVLQNLTLLAFALTGTFTAGVFIATAGMIAYSNLVLWWWSPGPAPGFQPAAWRRLGREFAGFTLGHVGSLLNSSGTPILVATLFGLPAAGLWSFATRLGNVMQLAFEGFRRAAIPAAGLVADSPAALARLVEQSFTGAGRLTLPLMAGFFAALPVAGWLLPQWAAAVPIGQLYVLGMGIAGIVAASIMPVSVARRGYRAVLGEQFAPLIVGWLLFGILVLTQRPVIAAVVLPMHAAAIAAVWFGTERGLRPRWNDTLRSPALGLAAVCAIVVAGSLVGAHPLFSAVAAAVAYLGICVAPMVLPLAPSHSDAGGAV